MTFFPTKRKSFFYTFVHTKNAGQPAAYKQRGGFIVSRRRGIMSERLKEELAKELGFYDTVQKEGWGGIKQKMPVIWSNVP